MHHLLAREMCNLRRFAALLCIPKAAPLETFLASYQVTTAIMHEEHIIPRKLEFGAEK
jgi:hypothetical protein